MDVSTYKQKSNIIGSFSVKQDAEADYIEFRRLLRRSRMSIGDYLVATYREYGKSSANENWMKSLRFCK